jgi:hypothetical protein
MHCFHCCLYTKYSHPLFLLKMVDSLLLHRPFHTCYKSFRYTSCSAHMLEDYSPGLITEHFKHWLHFLPHLRSFHILVSCLNLMMVLFLVYLKISLNFSC